MKYRQFGKTNIKLSVLGFGAMRLPEIKIGEKMVADEEKSIELIRYAIDSGINYIDSAYFYHQGRSENIVGQAIKDGYRDRVYISTKIPTGEIQQPDDFERFLDEQLKRLNIETIDFYHFHYLNQKLFEEKIQKMHLIERAERAKVEGKIRHIAFSFHDKPEVLKMIIDSGWFESMLVQYNMIDRSNEAMIQHAAEKGMGITIMGPIGGGRLGEPSPAIKELIPERKLSSAEIALKFVFANPNVDCTLSGMNSIQMVKQNILTASENNRLTEQEIERINTLVQEYQSLANLYCTGCNYCMPCPQQVNIPLNFRLMNYYRVYQIPEYAQKEYGMIGKVQWLPGKTADYCIACGECEPKCPQHIPIINQLQEVVRVLGKK
ncbi:aldo/keto reductase [candidate division KSB1 bacterium]|nr:aldo/keto reductase [candidate division KSB1 bacterium]